MFSDEELLARTTEQLDAILDATGRNVETPDARGARGQNEILLLALDAKFRALIGTAQAVHTDRSLKIVSNLVEVSVLRRLTAILVDLSNGRQPYEYRGDEFTRKRTTLTAFNVSLFAFFPQLLPPLMTHILNASNRPGVASPSF